MKPPGQSPQTALTVTGLNNQAKNILEQHFFTIWLQGELSNFSTPSSGHWYFSLKDNKSQIRCAMFKQNNRSINCLPKNGDKLLVRGRVSLYTPRGDYQLIIDQLKPAGRGDLQQAFEQLKAKLAEEGLFEDALKLPLPLYPTQIGIITSRTGAALRDILHVLSRRCPTIPIVIYPCSVQGEAATPEIINAIKIANRHAQCDVLILARGGGSLEDLWCFNEERVARAIAASHIPIVSGVGHQTDFTIADMVADLRAPTPSAAAEQVGPEQQSMCSTLIGYEQWFFKYMHSQLNLKSQHLRFLQKQLKHPGRRIEESAQRADEIFGRIYRAVKQNLRSYPPLIETLQLRLKQASPSIKIDNHCSRIKQLKAQLAKTLAQNHDNAQQQWQQLSHRLHLISPLATLERGYSVTLNSSGNIVRNLSDYNVGDSIETITHNGHIRSQITYLEPKTNES